MARKKKDAFMVLTEKCKGDDCSDEMMQLRSAIRLILIPEGSVSYKTCKPCEIPKYFKPLTSASGKQP
jgi:hypothetical protein